MKCILIDAVKREVREVNVDVTGKGDEVCHNLEQMYRLIDCTCIDHAGTLPNNDTMYVDDEGLLTGPEHFFMWQGYLTPLAGNGLLCGTGPMGEAAEVQSTVEEIRSGVSFLSAEETLLIARAGGF